MPPSCPARAARPWLPTPQLPSTFRCSSCGQEPARDDGECISSALERWKDENIEEGFIQKRRQRLSLLFGGQIGLNSLPRLLFITRTIRPILD